MNPEFSTSIRRCANIFIKTIICEEAFKIVVKATFNGAN